MAKFKKKRLKDFKEFVAAHIIIGPYFPLYLHNHELIGYIYDALQPSFHGYFFPNSLCLHILCLYV